MSDEVREEYLAGTLESVADQPSVDLTAGDRAELREAARRLRERGEVRKALDLGRPYEIHVFPALNEESPGLRSYCRVLMNTGQEYEGCGSSVGEAVVEALADARTALDTDEPGEGEREPCIECDHPMNLHDEHVGCTVGWENLSQGCPCPQGADPAPEEEPSYRCRICGRPTDGVTICRYCDRGKRWVMQEMTDRGLADPAPEEEPEGIAELGRRLTEAFHALQNQLGEDPGPPELSDAVHTVEAVAFELTSDRPAPEDPDRGPDDVPRYLAEADDVPTEHIIGAALEDGREKGETRIELQKRVKRYLELLDRLRSRPSSFEACPSCEAVPIPEHADECPNCGYRGENEPVGQTAARPSSGDGEEVGDE